MKRILKKIVKNSLPYGIVNYYLQEKINNNIPNNKKPPIYNNNGKQMEIFFIKDYHMAHIPYGITPNPYFLWDRNNFGLDIHFYTNNFMLNPYRNAKHRFGWLVESESIVPHEYKSVIKAKTLWNEYEKIFTFSSKVLDLIPNSYFVPASSLWYGVLPEAGGELYPFAYEKKKKNISFVSSNKKMCPLHYKRLQLALYFKNNPSLGVDTFGTFDGGENIPISKTLTDYRYSFAIENFISPGYFTEKLFNCFASMSVPIYFGAPDIGNYFNKDGILFLKENDFENIESITKQCTEQEYFRRIDAIKDNYNRVMEYISIESYMYNHYLKQDLKKS